MRLLLAGRGTKSPDNCRLHAPRASLLDNRNFSTTTNRTKKKERRESLKARANVDEGGQEPPTNAGEFAPMSDYEYEKSLWEAAHATPNSVKGQSSAPSERKTDAAHGQTHRPNGPGGRAGNGSSKPRKSKDPTTKDGRKSRLAKGMPVHIKKINPINIDFKAINDVKTADWEVPRLAHNLERALFNPGVFQLQDPRSKVFNFDPYLSSIMPVDEFDFDALREYITSSKDEKLHEMAKQNDATYCGSTSSMTSVLAHFHYLISHWRLPQFPTLTQDFVRDSDNFTQLTRAPAATYITHKDGIYAMDADKEYDFGRENILMMLGHSMEKLLTLPPEEFEKYRRDRSHQLSEEDKDAGADAFHYGKIGKFLMRSQLDAQDPRLPGTGVFDIKTRAVFPIRIDLNNYRDHAGYEITERFGQLSSYEREYYDLIRAAFLRYSLQVRIGRMDGCFVAYHNTRRIFGFQYVSLDEMDLALHGTTDRRIGDQEFRLSVSMLENLLDMATAKYPGRKMQIYVETRATNPPVLYFFARPVTDEEIRRADEKALKIVDQAQTDMKTRAEQEDSNLDGEVAEEAATETEKVEAETPKDEAIEMTATDNAMDETSISLEGNPIWEEMIAKVEEVVEDEAMGVESVRDAVQDAFQQNDLLKLNKAEELTPSIETLVEALVAETMGLRESRQLAEATAAEADADANGTRNEGDTTALSQTGDQTDGSATTPTSANEGDQESIAARTEELKELVLKFTRSVDHDATEAQGFERALREFLTKAKAPADVSGQTVATADEGTSEQTATSDSSDKGEYNEQADTATREPAASTDDGTTPAAAAVSETTDSKNGESKRTRPGDECPEELFGAVVSVVNTQHGKNVKRPVVPTGEGELDWTAHYTIHEMDRNQMEAVYPAVRKRRWKVFGDDRRAISHRDRETLLRLSKQGLNRRRQEDQTKEVSVAWDMRPHRRKPEGDGNS